MGSMSRFAIQAKIRQFKALFLQWSTTYPQEHKAIHREGHIEAVVCITR
jgi:hypothetical protein